MARRHTAPISRATPNGVAMDGLFSVAAAVEFAHQRRGDCSTLITYVALRETGMLDAYITGIRQISYRERLALAPLPLEALQL